MNIESYYERQLAMETEQTPETILSGMVYCDAPATKQQLLACAKVELLIKHNEYTEYYWQVITTETTTEFGSFKLDISEVLNPKKVAYIKKVRVSKPGYISVEFAIDETLKGRIVQIPMTNIVHGNWR